MRTMSVLIFFAMLIPGLLIGSLRYARAEVLPKKIPVTVTADKLNYDRNTDIYVAEGHVKIEQEGVRLEADKVVLNGRTGEAEATGKVYLQDKENVVHADNLKVNLNRRAFC